MISVDWTVLTASLAGMGLATLSMTSDGLAALTRDIRDHLAGIEMTDGFRDLIGQVCAASGVAGGAGGMTFDGMPVTAMLIYQASDFVGGLPREAGARAAGGQAQSLTLSPNARPIVMLIADDDTSLGEVDGTQVLAQEITLNGQTFGAGFDISSAYTLADQGSGMVISSLHFGDPWSGYWQGPVIATAASNPLEPGETYSFDSNFTTHNNEFTYDDYLSCG
jgi:hypothetical protein